MSSYCHLSAAQCAFTIIIRSSVPTEMTEKEQRNLQIWTDPESKIRFLETVMHDKKNWRADIHVATLDTAGARHLAELTQKLKHKGYEVEHITHDDGHQILRLKHHHDPQDLGRLFHDYGFVTGAAHLISRPLVAVKDIIVDAQHRVEEGINYLKDPARANGLIFLTSEAFITASSLGAKEGKWHDPKNLLLSVAGSLFLSQSATYLFLAKKGNERVMDDMQARIRGSIKKDGDTLLPELGAAPLITAKKSSGIADKVSDFFNAYPIQIGAMANNLGMMAFLGAFWLERKYQTKYLAEAGEAAIAEAKAIYNNGFAGLKEKDALKAANYVVEGVTKLKSDSQKAAHALLSTTTDKPALIKEAQKYIEAAKIPFAENYLKSGYWKDTMGACTSIIAWTFMMLPPKETKEKSSTPLVRFWQTIRENPQQATSAIALGSSSMRLLGARERENILQTIGEAIYIPGDLMLWFTKNNEYGHSVSDDNTSLVHSAANLLNRMPVVMSAQREKAFVHDVACYLTRQNYALKHGGTHMPENEVPVKAAEIEVALEPLLKHEASKKFDLLMGKANRLLEQFDPTIRPAAAKTLTQVICDLKGVEAMPNSVAARLISEENLPLSAKTSPVALEKISKEISDLVFTIPGPYAAENASMLYDALAPLLQPHCDPKKHLDEVMTASAEKSLGIKTLKAPESAKPDTVIAAHALRHEPPAKAAQFISNPI